MPMFKKSGGKIFAVQFNKAEERALDQEIKKQIVENDRAFDMDKESSILWMLHTQFRFGPKRLQNSHKRYTLPHDRPSGTFPAAHCQYRT